MAKPSFWEWLKELRENELIKELILITVALSLCILGILGTAAVIVLSLTNPVFIGLVPVSILMGLYGAYLLVEE